VGDEDGEVSADRALAVSCIEGKNGQGHNKEGGELEMKKQGSRAKKRKRKKDTAWEKLIAFFMVLVFAVTFATPLLAAGDRFADGMKDVTRGGFSIPAQIAKSTNEHNALYGVVEGTVKGAFYTVGNVVEGVFKVLTFYAPNK